jgi:hypothetical protein
VNGWYLAHCRLSFTSGLVTAKAEALTCAIRRVLKLSNPLNVLAGDVLTGRLWPIPVSRHEWTNPEVLQFRSINQGIVLTENNYLTQTQLDERWQVAERTLERWRSEGTGPIYMKMMGSVHSPFRHHGFRGELPSREYVAAHISMQRLAVTSTNPPDTRGALLAATGNPRVAKGGD